LQDAVKVKVERETGNASDDNDDADLSSDDSAPENEAGPETAEECHDAEGLREAVTQVSERIPN
jgi:hypothetical protein